MPLAAMVAVATALVASLLLMVLVASARRTVPAGSALIVSRMNAVPKVVQGGTTLVLPVVHSAETMDLSVHTLRVRRTGSTGLICRDNIRADIELTFFVRVNATTEDILKVAQTIGCARASAPDTLEELFTAKFSEALKTVGKRLDFDEMLAQRDAFRDEVFSVIGRDLNGFVLDDLAIDHLEQTPLSQLDPGNILDAQGIRKVTERAAAEAVAAKQAELERDRALLALQEEHDALRRKLR